MARRRKKKTKSPLDYISLSRFSSLSPDVKQSIWVVGLLAFGVICLLSLYGLAGGIGPYLVRAMTWLVGWGKWFIPILLMLAAWLTYQKDKYEITGLNYIGIFLFWWSFQGLLHIFIEPEQWDQALANGLGGGRVGWSLAATAIKLFDFWAGLIFIMALFVIGLLLTFNTNLSTLFEKGAFPARLLARPLRALFGRRAEREAEVEAEEAADAEMEEEPSVAEAEAEAADDSFSLKALAAGASKQKNAQAKRPAASDWKPSHIVIDLPLDLLQSRTSKPTAGDLKAQTEIIKMTLEKFGIPVEMGEVSVGPTVTQYTLKPEEGIKLSRITALNNDLSMALAAHPVRIEAPIPGKSLVGIEVPNRHVAVVGLRETLESSEFKNRPNNLMVALGKDVAGNVWFDSIAKMPHLLVAGATGSGKSVMLNTLIMSLLYQNNPDDLKFIMVDPKRVELTVYNGLPHLLTPVITEVSKTINALKWCLNEMDRRFETLAADHKRDIASYNQSAKEKMPYIIFIIDELADLMVVAAKDMETGIVRLSQMARAVGIHLVLATQRPSVNVITGTIKANMPARIAFSVASGIDSRTILDSLGAEKLLGRGDMLFSNTALTKPKRIQGALITDQEIKRIVTYIKERSGEPRYVSEIVERQKVRGVAGVGIDGASDDDDELFEEAKELIINSGKASASYLQRRLSVGYARAARLLDLLEETGVIGPSNGAKPREILVTQEQYAALIEDGVAGVHLHDRETVQAPESYLGGDEEAAEDSEEAAGGEEEAEDAVPAFMEEAAAEAGEMTEEEAGTTEESAETASPDEEDGIFQPGSTETEAGEDGASPKKTAGVSKNRKSADPKDDDDFFLNFSR